MTMLPGVTHTNTQRQRQIHKDKTLRVYYRPNYPPKPWKNHLGNTFSPLESVFLVILYSFLHILVPFLECEKAKLICAQIKKLKKTNML